MTKEKLTEMQKLADELEKCGSSVHYGLPGDTKFITGFAMTEKDRGLIIAALRTAAQKQEPVADTWLMGGPPDLMALSGDIDSDRVIKLHFRRPATEQDQEWLLEAINAKLAHPPAPSRSYVDLSDSATTFDPERQYDQDRADEGR